MKLRRQKLLVEPPQSAASDIAFILIVFFLVCASVQVDTGRRMDLPKSEETEQEPETENLLVTIDRDRQMLNDQVVDNPTLLAQIRQRLAGKSTDEDRIVVVKCAAATPYHRWIETTDLIMKAGGFVALQLEEEQEVMVE